MKAMAIERYGKRVPLNLIEVPKPTPGTKDVLVEIHAASVNPVDFKIRDGKVRVLLTYRMPLILGNDFSGRVIEVGSQVTKFKVGDDVYGRPRKDRIGTFAEFIAVHEDDVSHKPINLSFEEAASVPLVGLTTWQAFHEELKLKKGDKILIHAGGGGVGTFAIQLAKAMGAYVATTASERSHELVASLGADQIIDYLEEKFEDEIRDFDAVYDTLGGEALERSFRVLKPNGTIVSISGLPDAKYGRRTNQGFLKTLLFSLVTRKMGALEKKYNVEYRFLFMRASGEQLAEITELIVAEKIKPVIDRVYSLQEAQQAIEYMETGRAKGKVIIKVK